MKKLGTNIPGLLEQMSSQNPTARLNLRINQVRARYRDALEDVYGPNAQLFLDHTNNVYIMDKDGVRTLIVYVDDSIFAAELNAQRELIKLKLLELFGEEVEAFEIGISRGNYKNNHPYAPSEEEMQGETPGQDKQARSIPLDDDERAYVEDATQGIEDPGLRERIQKAMTADLEWKKGEKESAPTKNTK